MSIAPDEAREYLNRADKWERDSAEARRHAECCDDPDERRVHEEAASTLKKIAIRSRELAGRISMYR